MSTTSRGPSRRTLVKGAAWSVPVVAMAQPVMAQDVVCSPNSCPPEECLEFSLGGNSCRNSPNDVYFLEFCVENTCDDGTIPPGTSYTFDLYNWSGFRMYTYPDNQPAYLTVTMPAPEDGPWCAAGMWLQAQSMGNGVRFFFDGEEVGNVRAPQQIGECATPPPGDGLNEATLEQDADVKVDEVPATTDAATAEPAPAPAAPVEPAPAPAAPVEPAPAPAPPVEDGTTDGQNG